MSRVKKQKTNKKERTKAIAAINKAHKGQVKIPGDLIMIRKHRFTLESEGKTSYFVVFFEHENKNKTIKFELYDAAYIGDGDPSQDDTDPWYWMEKVRHTGRLKLKTYDGMGNEIYHIDFELLPSTLAISQRFDFSSSDVANICVTVDYLSMQKTYVA